MWPPGLFGAEISVDSTEPWVLVVIVAAIVAYPFVITDSSCDCVLEGNYECSRLLSILARLC